MKRNDMIQIDSSKITTENEVRYWEFYEVILNTISEAYRFIYYLEGLEQLFGKGYKHNGSGRDFFVNDIIELLKEKICLNIWKLNLDKGKDSLTLNNMHKYIIKEFNYTADQSRAEISSDLEGAITDIRNKFISHNLNKNKEVSVEIKKLKVILDECYKIFQKHWIKNFIDNNHFLGDRYFDDFESFYIDAIQAAFAPITP